MPGDDGAAAADAADVPTGAPLPRYVVVEYPGRVVNVDRAYATLGGVDEVGWSQPLAHQCCSEECSIPAARALPPFAVLVVM